MVKNWCDLLDLGTLKSALSQEWMNEWIELLIYKLIQIPDSERLL